MKKCLFILAFIYPISFIIIGFYTAFDFINYLNNAKDEMDNLINYSYHYCVDGMQDPDLYDTIIINQNNMDLKEFGYSSVIAEKEYQLWLREMEKYRTISLSNGTLLSSTITSGKNPPDLVFMEMIDILADIEVQEKYHFSPINFGVAYINTEILESSMEKYMHDLITDTHNFFSFSKNVKYNINPDTIKVEATVNITPYNLTPNNTDKTSVETEFYYKTLFGREYDIATAQASDNMTMLKNKIDLKVSYDIIPKYPIFWIPSDASDKLAPGPNTTPPENMYFPAWDNGSINNGMYTITIENQLYSFEYIMIN